MWANDSALVRRLLHARLGEQRLEATRQPILQREGDGSGDRGDPVGQHIRQAGLDVKGGDDLRADACRQRVDDLGLLERTAREAVNRSVLNATWCAQTAIVATRIVSTRGPG